MINQIQIELVFLVCSLQGTGVKENTPDSEKIWIRSEARRHVRRSRTAYKRRECKLPERIQKDFLVPMRPEHTRSHLEHEGKDGQQRQYLVGDRPER